MKIPKPEIHYKAQECRGASGCAVASAARHRFGSAHIALCLLSSVLGLPSSAQFSLDWSTIDGGGGTSTNGQYSLTGTIGQPDAGVPLTNSQYSVTGGFWALPAAVQTPGAPFLSITLNPQLSTIQLSWSPATPGWVLQENLNLATSNWVSAPSGTNNPAIVPATLPSKYYRLLKL